MQAVVEWQREIELWCIASEPDSQTVATRSFAMLKALSGVQQFVRSLRQAGPSDN
jgi:hypothetical protein